MRSKLLLAAMVLPFCVLLIGCAAGRNDATGEIVVGLGVAKLTESTNQALSQLGDYFLPGLGGSIGLLGAAGLGWARSHAKAKQLEGANVGFDEGAARAAPVAPAPSPQIS